MTLLEKTLRSVVLAGVFALPFVSLVVISTLFFPYITGKNFAFRIIVEIMAGAWLALALVNSEYRPRRSWVLAALAVFVLLIAVSNATGVNPFKSFWSNFERMDGWVSIAHLLVYTVVAAATVRTERLWRWLWWTTLGVSAYLSLYGLLQVAGFTTLGQGGAAGLSARVDATFGNPIYLAVYMLFHIFIAAMLWVQNAKARGGHTFLASWCYGIIIVLDTLTLFLTGTRGTILGLIGGALLSVFIFAVFGGSRRVRVAAVASIIAIVALGGLIRLGKDTSFVKNIGFLDRLASISVTDQTIASRFINMSIAWQGVKERPVFGWGQENYAIVFDKYYDPRMYRNEPWFDRVHNIIFDWWIAGGTLGLLSYLAIFAATLWTLWRYGAFTLAERAILTGLLAGYFVHNLTVFDNVTSYILFGTLLAYISHRSSEYVGAKPLVAREFSRVVLPYIALVCAVGTWGVAWGVNAGALSTNRALLAAISQQGNPDTNLKYFLQAASYNSIGTQEVREQLSQGATQVAQATNLSSATKQAFYDAATREMIAQAEASPLDARFPLFLGIMYDAFGNYAAAAEAYQKAHELSPKKQSIYYQIGQNAFTRGDTAAALSAYKAAYELYTENTEAKLMYAAIAIRVGQGALADQLLATLSSSGEAADPRILAAYVARGELAKAIPVWENSVAVRPDNMQTYFTLAALYYQTGSPSKAIEILEAAKKASPGVAAQADPIIQQIRSGTVKVQ
jgi:tetratricopeptide (TPR) repeat protein